MKRFPSLALTAALICIHATAQNATPTSGEYQVDGGWGTLIVKQDGAKPASFKISALGANGHTCGLEGAINNGVANIDTGEKGKACRVGFTVTAAGVDVKPLTEEECRTFCGMRATFDGLYAKATPGCEDAARSKARNRFKQLYDAKQYQYARATLEPLLTQCAKSLHWIEDGNLRNDLAITQFHLRDYSGCIATLQQFKGNDADQYLEGLKSSEPSSAEAYAAILGPARHNLMLCEKTTRKQ